MLIQVIGKSCKPIPVMVLGVLVGRKSYPLLKYLFILMIVAGVAMFMYKDGSKKGAQGGEGLIGVGEILLLVSLTCDGLTGAVQVRTSIVILSFDVLDVLDVLDVHVLWMYFNVL